MIIRLRVLVVALLVLLGLAVPEFASSAGAAPVRTFSCTETSSGSCIRGGEFCPEASYGEIGTDARGRRYICSGDADHPHWEITSSGGTRKHKYAGPVLSDGTGYNLDGRYKPKTTYLSGDGTLTMRKSHWTSWTRKHAKGHGIGYLNVCDPDCADGKTLKLKMSVVESVPRNACGKRYFTHYRVTFSRKPDKYISKSYTDVRWPITCA